FLVLHRKKKNHLPLRSQLRYVEPPYYGPGSDYMVEDPVSDTDDPNVKSNVVKSLLRIVHEYELELARTGEQPFGFDQLSEEVLSELSQT
ncbi:hypothetical protein MKW92_049812, partial [Papaver armeniacum]